ncbi:MULTISPECIES: SDR family oxidoreductase [Oceanobacillus]|uniref:Gluconate 5-dehydrogenase n=1 Tax=Oceanobacillus indicireducens TaxID=1004261 RepID=A0A917XT01_9BACI|nr:MULTISPECIES: SDR family oxidoreductase [Oceanobacillus]MCF3942942.1 SDR family oxidoreductase [Oceanobacillus alkalisoli]MCG5102317.1 SDR family oxidoreductase [Oceanobacillus alkalisoli]GGN52366.1 gluconate 5-dehydrogenase [Oceanobacillus indicireducens]
MTVFDLFRLEGKTAIITGGGRGLGAQMAQAFAEAGANVVVCSRKLESCKETSEELKKLGVDSLAFSCDVTNHDDIKRVVKETVEHFGSIDILVNNSGATWGASVVDMPIEAWHKVIDVNITGTYLMSLEVGKVMIDQNKGKIINIASIAGFGGTNPEVMDTIGYNTSKGAVITFTKDLAVKWGKHNINVNAIAPGFFPTKMARGLLEKGGDEILQGTPLNRFGNDQDLKGAALFLASKASDFVTGDILTVDGGSHAFA